MSKSYPVLAIEAVASSRGINDRVVVHESELYVVWFSKTLNHWKALVSTDSFDGLYWEVTHNGNKNETYVDEYAKVSNTVLG